MAGNCGGDAIKVVIINTQYVQTDATSFKSVVQKLTGKDSKVPDSPGTVRNSPGSRRRAVGEGARRADPAEMLRNLSFRELGRLMEEMPPMSDKLGYPWTG